MARNQGFNDTDEMGRVTQQAGKSRERQELTGRDKSAPPPVANDAERVTSLGAGWAVRAHTWPHQAGWAPPPGVTRRLPSGRCCRSPGAGALQTGLPVHGGQRDSGTGLASLPKGGRELANDRLMAEVPPRMHCD